MNTNIVCIYHRDCLDGLAAAAVVHKKCLPDDVTFVESDYKDEPPWGILNESTFLYIVDFSYPEVILQRLAKTVKYVTLIDHHQTAAGMYKNAAITGYKNVSIHIDTSICGARLAWKVCYPDVNEPEILYHVDNGDYYREECTYSMQVCVYLKSAVKRPAEFFNKVAELPTVNMAMQGESIIAYTNAEIYKHTEVNHYMQNFAGKSIPTINAPRAWRNVACQWLLNEYKNAPFAISFYTDAKNYQLSLRSRKCDLETDVAVIAELFGGGGHRTASGITIPDYLMSLIHLPNGFYTPWHLKLPETIKPISFRSTEFGSIEMWPKDEVIHTKDFEDKLHKNIPLINGKRVYEMKFLNFGVCGAYSKVIWNHFRGWFIQ